MLPPTIDLNADLGEGFPWDRELLDLVSSASISCGVHAGDRDGIIATIRLARAKGVRIGAHPGYPDRKGFGRVERDVSRGEVAAMIVGQVEEFNRTCTGEGVIATSHVKPHGALYNQAQRSVEIAAGVVDGLLKLCAKGPCRTIDQDDRGPGVGMMTQVSRSSESGWPGAGPPDPGHLPASRGLVRSHPVALLGLPNSEVEIAARREGIRFVAEGFADRGYRPDGSLIPRGQPGATLDDPSEIADQVERLLRSGRVETLCIHGDSEGAVRLAVIVRSTLDRLGVAVRAFSA